MQKVNKKTDIGILTVIQECIACTHRGPNFTTGKTQKNDSLFNKDVLIQQRRVKNHRYNTHLFSLRFHRGEVCGHGLSETINKVVTGFGFMVSTEMDLVNILLDAASAAKLSSSVLSAFQKGPLKLLAVLPIIDGEVFDSCWTE